MEKRIKEANERKMGKDWVEKNIDRGKLAGDMKQKLTLADIEFVLDKLQDMLGKMIESNDGIRVYVKPEDTAGYKKKKIQEEMKKGKGATIRKGWVDFVAIPTVMRMLFALVDTSASISEPALKIFKGGLCRAIVRNNMPTVVADWDYAYQGSEFVNPLNWLQRKYLNNIILPEGFKAGKHLNKELEGFLDEVIKKLSTVKGRAGTGNFHKFVSTVLGIKDFVDEGFKKDLDEYLNQLGLTYDELISDKIGKNILIATDMDFLRQSEFWNNDKFMNSFVEKLKSGKVSFTVVSEDLELISKLKSIREKLGLDENVFRIIDIKPLVEKYERFKKD